MPGGGNGGALIGGSIVLVLLTMMTLDIFSGFWDTMMENKGPVVMVVIGLLIAWFSTRDEGASSSAAVPLGRPGPGAHGQHAAAPAPPHPSSASWMPPSSSGGGGGDGSGAIKRQQAGDDGSGPGGSNALSLLREHSASGKLGTLAAPPRRRRVQGNMKNGSAAGLVAVHASSSSSSLAGSTQDSGSGSTALVAVDEARSCTFMCTKPAGCGYRHACPDLGRRWMHCNKHGSHPLPPDGSVWREEVPEREAGGGSLRLCLAWDGTALDVTALGACRGWDQDMTAAVCALLDSGRRMSGMCSQSPSFPMLHKWQEVAAMDYRAVARGRRLWSMLERWLTNKKGIGSSRPLAIEMGRRT